MIDVLLPVLARPHRVEPLLENLLGSTQVPLRILFLVSYGDTAELYAVKKAKADHVSLRWPPANGQYAKKINLGYRSTENEWLFLGADDIKFHPGWAERAIALAKDRFHVISTNDKANYFVRQGLLATHSLVRRSYVDDPGCSLDGPGRIYHEGYQHNFVDVELSVLARQRGVFKYSQGSVVEHLHPLFKKGEHDRTYELGLADFAEDRALFAKRCADYAKDPLARRFIRASREYVPPRRRRR